MLIEKTRVFLWSFYSKNWNISKIRLLYLIGVFVLFIFISLRSISKISIRIPRFGIRLLDAINRKYTSCFDTLHSVDVFRHLSVAFLVVVTAFLRIISCNLLVIGVWCLHQEIFSAINWYMDDVSTKSDNCSLNHILQPNSH